jgi:hypothetical protein
VTWNAKQNALNGTGFVKANGTTISYDNNTYYLASNPNGYTSNLGTVTSVTASSPLFSSGGATPNLTIQQASGSQSGFLSSANWTTFNNKIAGSGTLNRLAKFTAAGTVGDSQVFDNGTNVGIGTTSPSEKLHISGGNIIVNSASAFGWGDRTTQIVGNTGASGFLRFDTNNSERMRITSGGNLLINTPTDAGFRLDVNGTGRFSGALQVTSNVTVVNGAMEFTGSGSAPSTDPSIYRVGGVNSLAFAIGSIPRLTIASTGAATFSNSVTATAFFTTSDKRKKDIISQDGDLAIYRFKGDSQIHYGYIAQDMQALYPNQVSKGKDGMLSLNYVEILVKKVHDLESKLKRHGLD